MDCVVQKKVVEKSLKQKEQMKKYVESAKVVHSPKRIDEYAVIPKSTH